ncbi:MAG: S8 family serine peptidase [Actinobacteria bacterium]|nr:S8 family serine peptidase [Actinomycetota bacterium]
MNVTPVSRHARRPLRRWLPALVTLTLLATAAPGLASTAPVRVVVDFAAGVSAGQRAAALADAAVDRRTVAAASVVTGHSVDDRVAPTTVAQVTAAQRARLAADPRVDDVYDDIPVRVHDTTAAAVVPEDPAWSQQDGVRQIRAADVWEHTTGDPSVTIAVVDTGVDPDNADLQGRLVDGHDFVNADADPRDDNGHGTAAATIAAAAGDTVGIAGVCWQCRVMPVKVLDETGKGFLSDAANGIAWAVEHGADIINVSLGAPDTMPLLDDALQAAVDAGVLVVASAGNAGDTAPQWPAADDRAMAIAALETPDTRASYSNHGSWVDVAAPGCNPAGWLDEATVSFCGTSSAAPLVSGAAALLTAARDAPAATVIRTALADTAVHVGPGLGSGRVDALSAFLALPTFVDISASVHAENIEKIAAAGLTDGCTPDRYCPDAPVTRAQMASFLDRALDLDAGTATFADVSSDNTHAASIAAIAAAGISNGCAPSKYCPAAPVTRAQMASFLDRALDLANGPTRFADVDPDGVHAIAIYSIAAAEITNGCVPDRYCPRDPVTRGQMASFLARALEL